VIYANTITAQIKVLMVDGKLLNNFSPVQYTYF